MKTLTDLVNFLLTADRGKLEIRKEPERGAVRIILAISDGPIVDLVMTRDIDKVELQTWRDNSMIVYYLTDLEAHLIEMRRRREEVHFKKPDSPE